MENYIIANCTDTGRVRSINEDSMATFDSPNGRVVVVCDGMGGQNAGDVASQLAVTVIQDILTDNTFATPEEAISRSIMAANQAILHRASQDEGLSGMGATCVMLIIQNRQVYYGSVGDSRIYYIANQMIRQITKDQSYVQTLVDAGEITQEAAEHHQDKNQITNALGIEGMTPPVIGQIPITPEPDSIFLLCSDGLSGMLTNNAILNIVSRQDLSLNERAQLLVQQANEAGGVDNITVQLVEFSANATANLNNGASIPYAVARRRRKNSTLFYTLIAVLMLIAIVGGGAYWYFRYIKPEPKPVVAPSRPYIEPKTTQSKTTEVKEPVPAKKSEEPQPVASPKKSPQNKKIEKKKELIKELPINEDKKDEGPIEKAAEEIKTENLSNEKK